MWESHMQRLFLGRKDVQNMRMEEMRCEGIIPLPIPPAPKGGVFGEAGRDSLEGLRR